MPVGQSFTGDLDVTASEGGIAGRLRLTDLKLEAFRPPAGCRDARGPFTIEADTDRVDMVAAPEAGYVLSVTVYDSSSCTALPADRFTYEWTADDPSLLQVTSDGERVELAATRSGRTALRVRVQETGTGTAAGDTVIDVVASA